MLDGEIHGLDQANLDVIVDELAEYADILEELGL